MKAYRLYGLLVHSELELPELSGCDGDRAPDVVVTLAPVASINTDGTEIVNLEVVLSVSGIARFTMSGGSHILISPHTKSTARDIRLYLLGSAFAAILHQRGLLPLHSNAIVVQGVAVAFLGRSGAGKSTLATWMHDQGHAILSDDVCVISRSGTDTVVHRGIPRLRLWRDSLEASGRQAEDQERVADFAEKFALHIGDAHAPETAEIKAFYLLSDDHVLGPKAAIGRVTASEAVRALMENTYRGAYVRLLDRARSHFEQCTDLARRVPVFRLQRPWDLSSLQPVCRQIEAHVASIMVNHPQC